MVTNYDLSKGTVVEQYQGTIVSFENIPDTEICYALLINDRDWLIINTNARYINHSCSPNCIVDEDLYVRTIRDVKEGEELTICYNIVRDNENPGAWDPRWSFECQCHSENCQKHVNTYRTPDGRPWLPI